MLDLRAFKLTLVAPAGRPVPHTLTNLCRSRLDHERWIDEIERFRGRVYCEDHALPTSALDAEGRDVSTHDQGAWHVVARDDAGEIRGVVRTVVYPAASSPRVEDLHLASHLERLAGNEAERYRRGVAQVLEDARHREAEFAEYGGLAVDAGTRYNRLGTLLVLANWANGRNRLQSSLGVMVATTRHGSAALLRKVGAWPLTWEGAELPAFFDEFHRSEVQVLVASPDVAHPAFEPGIREVQAHLAGCPCICHPATERLPSQRHEPQSVD